MRDERAEVARRVALDEQQVGALADGDEAEVRLLPVGEEAGGVERRGADRLRGRQARLGEDVRARGGAPAPGKTPDCGSLPARMVTPAARRRRTLSRHAGRSGRSDSRKGRKNCEVEVLGDVVEGRERLRRRRSPARAGSRRAAPARGVHSSRRRRSSPPSGCGSPRASAICVVGDPLLVDAVHPQRDAGARGVDGVLGRADVGDGAELRACAPRRRPRRAPRSGCAAPRPGTRSTTSFITSAPSSAISHGGLRASSGVSTCRVKRGIRYQRSHHGASSLEHGDRVAAGRRHQRAGGVDARAEQLAAADAARAARRRRGEVAGIEHRGDAAVEEGAEVAVGVGELARPRRQPSCRRCARACRSGPARASHPARPRRARPRRVSASTRSP